MRKGGERTKGKGHHIKQPGAFFFSGGGEPKQTQQQDANRIFLLRPCVKKTKNTKTQLWTFGHVALP